jgi:hypothetical protein
MYDYKRSILLSSGSWQIDDVIVNYFHPIVIPIMISAMIATVNKIVRKVVIFESLKDTFFM